MTRQMNADEIRVWNILKHRRGEESAISNEDLARYTGLHERRVRKVVNDLLTVHAIPIASKAGIKGGYYTPTSAKEIERFANSFYARAMTGLRKMAALKRTGLEELSGQLILHFIEEIELDAAGEAATIDTTRETRGQMRLQIVDNLLAAYKEFPNVYGDELQHLREKYAMLFLTREQVRKITDVRDGLNEILQSEV